MEASAIHQRLLGQFGVETVLSFTAAAEGIRDPFIVVGPRRIDRIGLYCRLEPDLACDFLQSLTALDQGPELELVYHLYSYRHRHTVVLKCRVPREAPELPSCTSVWPAADWYEREAFDLFGVSFAGHKDLRRLLLPEDWPGHPMRKDWKEPPTYNGMPTTRENPLELLAEADAGSASRSDVKESQ